MTKTVKKTAAKPKTLLSKVKSVLAKTDDGSIQITFTLPWSEVKSARDKVIKSEAEKIEVPGFRKGKAPLDKAVEKIPAGTLIEKTLAHFYPDILKAIIEEHKVKPATYPKIEVVKIKEGEDWVIRALTCEIPNISLGDYRNEIIGLTKSKTIWTPGKGDQDKPTGPSREEKEQEIIKALLTKIEIQIPKILIEEEVNSRLSQLLERIEKLGLKLESYLASVGKDPEKLRVEYEEQAKSAISLELILSEIAIKENISVSEAQIEETIKAAAADPQLAQKLNTPEQKAIIKNILTRRAVLDSLVALV